MPSQVAEYPAIWIAGGSCSGCSVSLLNTVSPNIANFLLDPVLPGKHVNLRFHATIMTTQGEPAVRVFQRNSQPEAKRVPALGRRSRSHGSRTASFARWATWEGTT